MSPALTEALAEGRDLTPDETREYLEQQTQTYLRMSLGEFLALAEAGELPEHPVVAHLLLLTGARATSC
ncbi:MAG TPA: hypothetical protein VGN51_01065 [Acidimicrobiia bacterium]|jgi:hypothetical protein